MEDFPLNPKWWAVVIRGIIAILIGISALIWPGMTAGVLIILFGSFLLVDGIFAIISVFNSKDDVSSWGVLLIEGLINIFAGISILMWPGLALLVFLMLLGFWAFFAGTLKLAVAIKMKKVLGHVWLVWLSAILSFVFGIIIFFQPASGLLAIVWLIGIFVILMGILTVTVGLMLRNPKAVTG